MFAWRRESNFSFLTPFTLHPALYTLVLLSFYMASTALVDDLLPSYQQALSILQRSESKPSTDDEKKQYQQEVLNILNNKTTANDFVEKCKIMAQAALDVDSAFDRLHATFAIGGGIVFPAAYAIARMRLVSE